MDRLSWYKSLSVEQKKLEIDKFCSQLRREYGFLAISSSPTKPTTEKDIEDSYAAYLIEAGKSVKQQVKCNSGIIDILTNDTIYEVKLNLTRDSIFHAIGQLFVYRTCMAQSVKLAIIGRHTKETDALVPFANNLNIEVIIWNA